jgi:hypothetical protein
MTEFIYEWNLVLVIACWLIAFVTGFFIVYVWKKGMNTALLKTQADDYVVPGSLKFQIQKDRFLYSTVTKTRRQTQSSGGTRPISMGLRR